MSFLLLAFLHLHVFIYKNAPLILEKHVVGEGENNGTILFPSSIRSYSNSLIRRLIES